MHQKAYSADDTRLLLVAESTVKKGRYLLKSGQRLGISLVWFIAVTLGAHYCTLQGLHVGCGSLCCSVHIIS